jgi:hypothetical protein
MHTPANQSARDTHSAMRCAGGRVRGKMRDCNPGHCDFEQNNDFESERLRRFWYLSTRLCRKQLWYIRQYIILLVACNTVVES